MQVSPAASRTRTNLSDAEQPTRFFFTAAPNLSLTARTEFQRRFAFPAACLVFALLGVTVGVRPRRGGRAAGFVLTLVLISGYYFLFVAGAHYAQIGQAFAGDRRVDRESWWPRYWRFTSCVASSRLAGLRYSAARGTPGALCGGRTSRTPRVAVATSNGGASYTNGLVAKHAVVAGGGTSGVSALV